MERNGSTSELIKTAFITQLKHSFHSHQIKKYLHRVVERGTQESKAWIHSYNHAICISIIAFLKRSIHDQANCTTEAPAEQGESTNRAASRGTSKQCTCLGWHTSRGGILPPPPSSPKENFKDNILLQWLENCSCPKRQQKTQSQCCPHVMQETHANTWTQLVVMEMCLNLPNIISKNITQKWKRKQRMCMGWMMKRPDCSHKNLPRGLETFSVLN